MCSEVEARQDNGFQQPTRGDPSFRYLPWFSYCQSYILIALLHRFSSFPESCSSRHSLRHSAGEDSSWKSLPQSRTLKRLAAMPVNWRAIQALDSLLNPTEYPRRLLKHCDSFIDLDHSTDGRWHSIPAVCLPLLMHFFRP